MVKFLVEKRGVEVNQRDMSRGWTPLHRCARVAHYRHAPFLQIFEYLLSVGGDPSLITFSENGCVGAGCGVVELAVNKGFGWESGVVRESLRKLIEKYSAVHKKPEYVYSGPSIGKTISVPRAAVSRAIFPVRMCLFCWIIATQSRTFGLFTELKACYSLLWRCRSRSFDGSGLLGSPSEALST